MNRNSFLATTLFLMASCGIPTVTTLNSPSLNSEIPSPQPSDYHSLIINHKGDSYSASDNFLGYDIYYKIYPVNTGYTQLNSDDDSLTNNNNPTVAYLTGTLGYKLLVTSNSVTDPTSDPISISVEPTINLSASSLVSSDLQLSFDFSNLISNSSSISVSNFPYVQITSPNNTSFPSLRAFRAVRYQSAYTSLLPSNVSPSPSSFYKDWYSLYDAAYWSSFSLDADMSPLINSGTHTTGLEVDVFIASYAWSPETQTIYSRPEPWGVIHL